MVLSIAGRPAPARRAVGDDNRSNIYRRTRTAACAASALDDHARGLRSDQYDTIRSLPPTRSRPIMPKVVRCSAGWLCLAAHIHALSQRSAQSWFFRPRPRLRPHLTPNICCRSFGWVLRWRRSDCLVRYGPTVVAASDPAVRGSRMGRRARRPQVRGERTPTPAARRAIAAVLCHLP